MDIMHKLKYNKYMYTTMCMTYNRLTNNELLMALYYDIESGFLSEAKLLIKVKKERRIITR